MTPEKPIAPSKQSQQTVQLFHYVFCETEPGREVLAFLAEYWSLTDFFDRSERAVNRREAFIELLQLSGVWVPGSAGSIVDALRAIPPVKFPDPKQKD